MKILVIHNHYFFSGGEDVVVKSEMQMLQEQGHEVILYERSNKEFYREGPFEKLRFLLRDIFWAKNIYGDIRRLIQKEKPDIAHIHNMLFVISPAVYDACYDEGLPVVQSLHNYRFLCPKGVFYRDNKICEDCVKTKGLSAILHKCVRDSYMASALVSLRVLSQKRINNILNNKIALFISPSEFCKRKFLNYGLVSEDRVVVKPNFLSEDPGMSEGVGRYVLFIGALIDYKGINTLLKAFNRLRGKEIPLKLIGNRPSFVKIKTEYLENPHIEILGPKSFSETINFIKNAAFVVIPSECYETFSRVIIEAFACGVPVIVSRIGALPERVIENESGLLFEPQDDVDLAQKIDALFFDKEKIKRMGIHARKIYEEYYTSESNYEILEDVYRRVIKSEPQVELCEVTS